MAADTATAPTADELAWEATRSGLATMPTEQRQMFEDIAAYVDVRWPIEDEADVESDAERILELEGAVATFIEALGVEIEDDTEIDEIKTAIAERLKTERAEGEKDATIPSRASTAERKAMRLLLERRLVVTRFDKEGPYAGLIVAHCKGDSGTTYNLGYDPRDGGKWRCTCQEMKGQCSHLAALKMVTPA